MAYDKNTDYQAKINEAVAKGDYSSAAKYEQQRNEKINDLNSSGTNKYNATTTNKYSGYLNSGNTSSSGSSSSNSSGSSNSQFTGSSNGVNVYDSQQAAIKAKMNANSIAWYTASDEEKARLHAENQALAALLGGTVSGGYNASTGYWTGDADQIELPTAQNPSFDYDVSAPTWSGSQYSAQIDTLLNQILNRDKFSYDAETDDLYQQYKATYEREGDRAMSDTLASVAAQAGGMNSYAVTAANQANNYYAAQVADKVPELYQLAYSMYLDDIENQVRDLGILQEMDQTQYSRYRDTMSDWRDDRDFAYGIYRDDVGDYQWNQSFDYNSYRDVLSDLQNDKEWAYNVKQDEKEQTTEADRYDSETAYNRAMDMLANGVMPPDSVLEEAGISKEEAEALVKRYEQNLYL